ncbi:MAG TPA: hypothetical protein VF316_11040 [Polyangiaceae bacterium]
MRPLEFPLLADENINPEVVLGLRSLGKDVATAVGEGLGGGTFGTLAIHAGEPVTGIIYLRPGNITASFVLDMLTAIESAGMEVAAPFIVVAERKQTTLRVRVRHLGMEAK